MYESDITKFLRELLHNNPRIVEEQRKARAMWWDKKLTAEEVERSKDFALARPGYVYYDNPNPGKPGNQGE